jgi:AAA family ATP:ADP antiporter
LLVAIGAATSSLLDYLFSVQASAVHGKGAPLLSFFSLFWLTVAVISLVVQVTLGRRSLEKLGLVVNIAILPGIVIMGGAFGLAMPGLFSTAILRGAEAVDRNTLYRSAYELLYTPLSESQKRAVKALIDVGFERLGTVLGALITMLVLAFSVRHSPVYILGGAIALAVVSLPIARALHRGYVTALETGLRDGALKLDLPSLVHVGGSAEETDETLERDNLIQRVELLRPRHAFFAPSAASPIDIGVIEMPDLGAHGVGPAFDALARPQAIPDGRLLLDGDAEATAAALGSLPLDKTTTLAPFLILLLAHPRLHADALGALCRAAPIMTGQLIDALLDPSMDFVVRRRLPLALSACTSQRAADGLLLGITDERFEVRYACGRALMKMSDANAGIVISRQKIVQAILVEVDRKAPGAAPLEFEDDPSELEGASALVDDLLARDRVDRTLEHVFTILALHLDREPLRMAYRAIRHPDVRHRGTALEYLQTILPNDIRDAVWPLVGELAPLPPGRTAREILADLLRATVVQAKAGGERD